MLWIKPVTSDTTKAFCTLWLREFSISHGGENDLTQHASTEMHEKATQAKGTSNIGAFFMTSTAQNVKIGASEAAYVYYTV